MTARSWAEIPALCVCVWTAPHRSRTWVLTARWLSCPAVHPGSDPR